MSDIVKKANGLYGKLANCHPSLTRGQVWCHQCGHTQMVNAYITLRVGWPKHCGQTMSIDSPEERAGLQVQGSHARGSR